MGAPTLRLVVSHAALVAAAAAVPVPFADGPLRKRIARRTVRRLAAAYDLDLATVDVSTLADDHGGNFLKGVAKGVLLAPVRFMAKRVFVVLGVKSIVDAASEGFVRAFLIDHAFAEGWCAPAGRSSALALRSAIDATCKEVPVTPLEPLVRAAIAAGRAGMSGAMPDLVGAATSLPETYRERLRATLRRNLGVS